MKKFVSAVMILLLLGLMCPIGAMGAGSAEWVELTAVSTSEEGYLAKIVDDHAQTGMEPGYQFKVYELKKGSICKIYGFGYDRTIFYIAVLAETNFLTSTTGTAEAIANVECGTDVYPTGYTYHTVTVQVDQDCFLYVNYMADEAESRVWVAQEANAAAANHGSVFSAKINAAVNADLWAYCGQYEENRGIILYGKGRGYCAVPVSPGEQYTITSGYNAEVSPVVWYSSTDIGCGAYLAHVSPGETEGISAYKSSLTVPEGAQCMLVQTADMDAFPITVERDIIIDNTEKPAEKSADAVKQETDNGVKTVTPIDVQEENLYGKHGVHIHNGVYDCFKADGGTYIVRRFTRRGPNNLFQWAALLLGNVDPHTGFEASSVIADFSTDIVGPISIHNSALFPSQIRGMWAGGNHAVTGTENPTAEQHSLKCLVDGVERSADGVYYGDVCFVSENYIYFPQSVTGKTLTSATRAVTERREYFVGDQMRVRVRLYFDQAVTVDVYYGMQGVTEGFEDIMCANNEYYAVLADIASAVTLTAEERCVTMSASNGLRFDMELSPMGLGSYNHNTKPNATRVSIPEQTGDGKNNKVYYVLMLGEKTISQGSCLTWEGAYSLYFE